MNVSLEILICDMQYTPDTSVALTPEFGIEVYVLSITERGWIHLFWDRTRTALTSDSQWNGRGFVLHRWIVLPSYSRTQSNKEVAL